MEARSTAVFVFAATATIVPSEKKLVADERNKQKSMRKREIEGLGFCLRRAH